MKINEKILKKIENDRFYSKLYDKYHDYDLLVDAGFIDSKVEAKDFYNLNLLTTPVGKLLNKQYNNPIVLLSTGGFLPIHEGHIEMMNIAKNELEKLGYDVIGGYFSPSHEDYVSTKPYYNSNLGERLLECQKVVKNSDWLMIDPWECMYVESYINFTSVIDRLERYLKKYVDKEIKVAYVFGSDNAKFNYAFLEDGMGVCVSRNDTRKEFLQIKSILSANNRLFIENNDNSSKLSSRNIRKDKTIKKTIESEKNESLAKELASKERSTNFLIRDEGMLPFENLLKIVDKNVLIKAREKFLKSLKKLFQKEFGKNLKVMTIKVEEQLKVAYQELQNANTLSIDSYFNGNFNLNISRLFDISSPQLGSLGLIPRVGSPSFDKQISLIKKGSYTLVDDDSVSGETINKIKKLLPNSIEINEIYLLSNIYKERYFDVVDLRDFIIGVENSGLSVRLPNNENVRCPYLLPYVNLTTRASVKPQNQYDFSLKLWKLNHKFYKSLNTTIYLNNLEPSFIKFMKFIGFQENDKVEDICLWHINSLKFK